MVFLNKRTTCLVKQCSAHRLMSWLALILVLASACTATPQPSISGEPTRSSPVTPTHLPSTSTKTDLPPSPGTPTALPPTDVDTTSPSTTQAGSLTPSPQGTPGLLEAVIQEVSLFLRDGPSTLYAVQGTYPKDTKLVVQGRAAGDEWVKVDAPGGKSGWMAAEFIEFPLPLEEIPLVDVAYSIVLSGTVTEAGGAPISGVSLAVIALGNETLRAEAQTTAQGIFYIYMPPISVGYWNVNLVGLDCESQVVGEDCQPSGYVLLGDHVRITVPPDQPQEFVFEKTALYLSGQVEGGQGQAVDGLRVFARRDDGAVSWGLSGASGSFELPILPGEWEVYAVDLTTGRDGRRTHVMVVAEQAPEPVSVPAP